MKMRIARKISDRFHKPGLKYKGSTIERALKTEVRGLHFTPKR